jgi:hypothetical protein
VNSISFNNGKKIGKALSIRYRNSSINIVSVPLRPKRATSAAKAARMLSGASVKA